MFSELTPIIFIPGLMGSIGGEMLGYKSKWGFGVASWIYKPFIKELEGLGYTLNKDLFVCYYDWRKSCKHIVEQFLIPLILQIEEIYTNQKIDLLCHSMGGLVGRTYIQQKTYRKNVRNLISFGTPNKGNIDAYYLWNTGKINNNNIYGENQLLKIIKSGYVWLLTRILNIPLGENSIEKLHENFQGLKDLLPTYDYGYVLCYKNKNNNYIYIPNEYTKYENDFINDLNKNINILYRRIKNLYCFAGTNKETNKELVVDKKIIFNNGVNITETITTKVGDGTVTVNSATINYGKTFIMEEDHSSILVGSIEHIANIYNLKKLSVKKDTEKFKEYPLSIIFKNHIDMELKYNESVVARFKNMKFTTDHEFIIEEFGKGYLWVIFKNVLIGHYILEVFTEHREDYNIFVIGSKVEEQLTYKNVKKVENKIIFFFEI